MTSGARIRTIRSDEWRELRDGRLRALADARDAVRATINGYTWRSTVAVMGGEYCDR